jgi:hypothetical protein
VQVVHLLLDTLSLTVAMATHGEQMVRRWGGVVLVPVVLAVKVNAPPQRQVIQADRQTQACVAHPVRMCNTGGRHRNYLQRECWLAAAPAVDVLVVDPRDELHSNYILLREGCVALDGRFQIYVR